MSSTRDNNSHPYNFKTFVGESHHQQNQKRGVWLPYHHTEMLPTRHRTRVPTVDKIRHTTRNRNISRGYQQASTQREDAKGQETSGKCSSSLVVKSVQNRTTKITLFLIRLARNKRTSKSGKLTGK